MTIPTVHSERLDLDLHLGKRDKTRPVPGSLKLAEVMRMIPSSALPQVPDHGWGWGYDYGSLGWGMDGNGPAGGDSKIPGDWAAYQGCGDCWWAMIAHKIRELAKNSRRPIPPISDLTVVQTYSAYGAKMMAPGYDPKTGDNDNGTDTASAYEFLQTNPFKDDNRIAYPIEQVIEIAPGNVNEHLVATWLFQNIGIGLQLQQAQVDQFDQGKPWAYDPSSPAVGGHEVLQPGPNGLISWGERVGFLPSLIVNCNDESQSTLSAEMYNAVTGLSINDYSEIDLERYTHDFVQKETA